MKIMIYPLDQQKPKTKTKNQTIFAGVNENSMTFLYTLNRGGDKKTEWLKNVFFFKVYIKVEMLLTKKIGF